ncbi:MAG: inositol monophosphatase family protein [Alphaproteobacteria bacterium]|nr:inositol monophosphatase family protein [Alphaproteobacteria bacterium]
MDPSDIERARDVLHDLLVEAGSMALARRAATAVEMKDDGSPVTGADQAIDAWFAEQLPRAFPGVGVVGEEGAGIAGSAGTFFVDPIDGTQAYLDGLPYWGPTVCLVRDGVLELGAFYVPPLREYWFAARGHGAFRDGVRLTIGPPRWDDRRQVLLVPSRFHMRRHGHWPGKIRAFGSAAAHLALVAAGAGVATVVPRWSLWDVGCGALLVTEAGGRIATLDGAPYDVVNGEPGLPFAAGASTALQNLAAAFAGRTDGEG